MTSTSTTDTTRVPSQPPNIELQPPGSSYFDDAADYFIFESDISPSHTTNFSASSDDEEVTAVARVDDGFSHFIPDPLTGVEMMMKGADIWLKDEAGAWVLDEEISEISFMVDFVTPDHAYLAAYSVFDQLEFVGWVDFDGQSVAAYRGGPEAAQTILGGDLESTTRSGEEGWVEAWWSTDGYFTMVEANVTDLYGQVRYGWTVTDVGTTEVEPPADKG
jgi:hypothetical protein